jgi:hypothetical protein
LFQRGWVVQNPAERVIIFRVDPLNASVVHGLPKDLAIQAARKICIHKSVIVDTNDKFEER